MNRLKEWSVSIGLRIGDSRLGKFGLVKRILQYFRDWVLLPDEISLVQRNGFLIWVDPHEYIGRRLYLDLGYEEEVIKFLRHHIEAEDTVLDVGANIGFITLHMAEWAYNGDVIAIEADPKNFSWLNKNLDENSFNEVSTFQFAASDEESPINLHRAGNNYGKSSIYRVADEDDVIEVPAYRLDKFLDENEISEVDLVKMDIEGAEMNAVIGLGGSIEKIGMMVIELHLDHYDPDDLEWFIDYLSQFGNLKMLNGQKLRKHDDLKGIPQIVWTNG